MPTAKDQLLDDVHFIFEEIGRFLELQKLWVESKVAPQELKDALLWEIPHPTDERKKFTCGRAAMGRLEHLARLAAIRANIGNQVDILAVRTPLAKSLVRRFVVEGREVTISQVERALSEAARIAKRSLGTVTHYIPCHLMTSQAPERFLIGPIEFLNREAFRSRIAGSLWSSRAENRWAVDFLGDVTDYYRSFGWVAEVTILECDENTSERAALRAVTSALDCLQLFFGARHTREMRVGGPALSRDMRGKFTLKDGTVHTSVSYGSGPGEVGFQDDWAKFFDTGESQYLLALFGAALESAIEPKLSRPLTERFLDSVSWFGEATRERERAARIVKYVTALEQMLMTDEKDNIAELVSQRVAALCSDLDKTGDFEVWRGKAQDAYSLRSNLVHGSLSQRDIRVIEGEVNVHDVVQASILNALAAIGIRGLRTAEPSRKETIAWFEKIVERAKMLQAMVERKAAPNP